ncbi:MAG: molybdopterin converting factor subunit 1 [Proteobacteria bacterium]|nr:MAG: molybdopterin converting factor subunit 1 [Pseudomonadota bacterium]
MFNVTVEYFASLREQSGVDQEQVQVRARNYLELYRELQSKHGFDLDAAHVQVAVNDEFTLMSHPVQEGVRVVFIPPIAGG